MKVIKIAYITTIIPHYREPFLEHLHKNGSYSGISLTVFYGQHRSGGLKSVDPSEKYPNNFLHNIWITVLKKELTFQCGLIKKLRKFKPDVVIATHETHNISIMIAWLLRNLLGYKWVWWGHGYNFQKKSRIGIFNSLNASLKDSLLRNADGVITYTQRGAEYCRSVGVETDKIFTYTNTIDVKAIQEASKNVRSDELKAIKSRLNLEGKRVLLFSGRLYNLKRVDFLLRSLKRVQASLSNVALIILGHGPERALLESLAKNLDLRQVYFVGEITDSRRSAPYFILSELLVIPGLVGLAIVHGYAMGLPLVTTRHDFHSPEIDYLNEACGVMTLPNEETYARGILGLLNSEKRLKLMSESVLEKAKEFYLEKAVNRFLGAIKAVTSG